MEIDRGEQLAARSRTSTADAWAEQSLELEVEDDGGLVGSCNKKQNLPSMPSSTGSSKVIARSQQTPFFDFEGRENKAFDVVPWIRDGPSTYVNLFAHQR